MTDTDLNAAEANHRNIKALAKELDADDVLSNSVAPRGSRSASETAKFMGLSSSSDDDGKSLSDEERTAALVEQNARNLRALAKAAGADAVAVESDEDERNNRQKLMGL